MRRNRLATLSVVLGTSALAVGILTVYVSLDVMGSRDVSLLQRSRMLEQLATWLAVCALVLFPSGSIAAVVTGILGLKQIVGSGRLQGGSSLAWAGVILGVAGIGLASLVLLGLTYMLFLASWRPPKQ